MQKCAWNLAPFVKHNHHDIKYPPLINDIEPQIWLCLINLFHQKGFSLFLLDTSCVSYFSKLQYRVVLVKTHFLRSRGQNQAIKSLALISFRKILKFHLYYLCQAINLRLFELPFNKMLGAFSLEVVVDSFGLHLSKSSRGIQSGKEEYSGLVKIFISLSAKLFIIRLASFQNQGLDHQTIDFGGIQLLPFHWWDVGQVFFLLQFECLPSDHPQKCLGEFPYGYSIDPF
ncbi:phenylalanine ammonia-lyase [Puccinia sorghi]|uniref:Phenylalanine ammonia-lyase n=1 Tax=Puccinia sorghi TaxID=27349 RepID=A0A0L6UHN7_9BASI|nr:phenylalanine ammonia-lyase [Puccinia sorghi]